MAHMDNWPQPSALLQMPQADASNHYFWSEDEGSSLLSCV
ncbi:hypothetical protein CEV32_4193 [Brucella rhizosphaerae]|uniref:Uncharacterized protein n=1 Tax=Brucella rhizosphaerae TaxID=571254 RepID=A0A256FP74_9HYPH|nr:hypothetical protein CEV32_4193 [Brucella rhizosphaerae]